MNGKAWLGLILILSSYGQVLAPRRMFEEPSFHVFGYAFIPGNLLALSMSLLALGVILLSEGICQRLAGASLLRYALATPRRMLSVAVTAALSGLTLELIAQWLGKLWFYPYWTTWFYLLTLIPGFAFYWIAIVESYLAAKAVLDRMFGGAGAAARTLRVHNNVFGLMGLACLAGAAFLCRQWIAAHGWTFNVVRAVPKAPPFSNLLLLFAGGWLVVEWWQHRRHAPSLVDSFRRGYRVPALAVLASSAVLGLVMETQNSLNYFWRYSHFPAPEVTVAGVPASVLAAWPLQYLVFLLTASVLSPGLASLFWSPTRALWRAA